MCFQCFGGPLCELEDPECNLDVTTANLGMTNTWPHWPDVLVSQNLHLAYRQNDILLREPMDAEAIILNAAIRQLHDLSGNLPGGTAAYPHLVIGAGATQLLSAAQFALVDSDQGCLAGAQRPYWSAFRTRIVPMAGANLEWADQEAHANSSCFVEFWTSPNNPDGRWTSPMSGTRAIADLVYNWPAFNGGDNNGYTETAEPPVVIYSMSKIAGYSSMRLGWAFVREPKVAELMQKYVWSNGRASTDAQYTGALRIKAMVDSYGTETWFMSWLHGQMKQRWERLRGAIAAQSVFRLATEPGRGMHGYAMFALLKSGDGSDCAALLEQKCGVLAAGGEGYEADASVARIAIGDYDPVFDILLKRIAAAR